MKIIKQFAIICGLCLLGEGVASLLPFVFPGSVMAMLLTLLFLAFRWLKLRDIEESGNFLLSNMAFFFVPSATGIIDRLEEIRGSVLILVLISILSTIITMIVTYYTVVLVTAWMKRGRRE